MKQITSCGGPFIALERHSACEWSGVFGKQFVGESSPFTTDYAAACEATGGRSIPPKNCAIIDNGKYKGFIIAPPVETLIVPYKGSQLLIVQIETAEEAFSVEDLRRYDFDSASYLDERDVKFSTEGGSFVLFDSSGELTDIGENYLEFDLPRGEYNISNCEYVQSSLAELNLFRVQGSR